MTRLALVVVVAAAAFAAAAISPIQAPVLGAQSAYASHCKPGFKHADVSWSSKPRCLKAGQFCKKVRNPEYHKYGFQCVNGKLRKQTGKGNP
jgi:hypothetical protein